MAKIVGRNSRWRSSSARGGVVHIVRLLTSQRVVNGVKPRLVGDGLDDRLKSIHKLLVVVAIAGHRRRLSKVLLLIEVHPLQLSLGCCRDIDQLLLETHLLLRKILVGSHEFGVEIRVHVGVVMLPKLDSRRCKDWLRTWIHLNVSVRVVSALLALGEVSTDCCLGDVVAITVFLVCVTILLEAKVLVNLGRRSGSRKGRGFGCCPQPC